jgi:hypothetical protein
MKNCYHLLFLFIIVFLIFSCKKKDITPAYLYLSEKDFKDCIEDSISKFNKIHETDYEEHDFQMIRQQNFRDVYVSLNGKALGYWQLPCTIPLLPDYTGENNFLIIPCVRVPSSTLSTVQYHFVTPIERNLTIEKEEHYQISDFVIEYEKGISFPILETFAQSTRFSSIDTISNYARITINEEESLGVICLDDSLTRFNIVTDYFDVLGYNCRHFWEISYFSTGEMVTYLNFRGALSGATSQDMIVLPSTKGVWKKTYIDISEIVKMASSGSFRLSLRLGIRGYRDADVSTAQFYFQYVKLISMVAPY